MEQKLKYQLEYYTIIKKQLEHHLKIHEHMNELLNKNIKMKKLLMIKVDKVNPLELLKQEEWIEELDLYLFFDRKKMEMHLDKMLNKQIIQKEEIQTQQEKMQMQQKEMQMQHLLCE